jgi:glucose/arabinose dehydrogenase
MVRAVRTIRDSRASSSCGLGADLHAQLRARVHASGFALPIAFVQDPGDRAVQFVVQQNGHVRVIRLRRRAAGRLHRPVGGDRIGRRAGTARARVSPPGRPASGRFFVNFTNRSGDTVIARLRRTSDPVVADPVLALRSALGRCGRARRSSRSRSPTTTAGHLAFGPDGYLYIGLGDGGSGDDPGHRAQNPAELLGEDAAD